MFGYGVFAQLTFAQSPGQAAPGPTPQYLAAGLVFGASLSRTTSTTLTAGLTFAGALAKSMVKLLQAEVVFGATLMRSLSVYLAAGITFTATLIATYIPFPPIGTAYEWLIRARRRGRR